MTTATAHKNLDGWIAKFGGEPGFDPFANDRGKRGFEFEMNVAYYVNIKKASLVRDRKGDEQIRLLHGILAHDGQDAEEVGETLEHIYVPFQSSDQGIERGKRETITKMRVDTLKRVLSAAMPSGYAPYCRTQADPATQKLQYLDFQGQVLSNGKYEERQGEVNERVMEFIDEVKQQFETSGGGELEALQGAQLYLSKKPNPRNEKYPYTNYYSTRPKKMPVFNSAGSDEDTPF